MLPLPAGSFTPPRKKKRRGLLSLTRGIHAEGRGTTVSGEEGWEDGEVLGPDDEHSSEASGSGSASESEETEGEGSWLEGRFQRCAAQYILHSLSLRVWHSQDISRYVRVKDTDETQWQHGLSAPGMDFLHRPHLASFSARCSKIPSIQPYHLSLIRGRPAPNVLYRRSGRTRQLGLAVCRHLRPWTAFVAMPRR